MPSDSKRSSNTPCRSVAIAFALAALLCFSVNFDAAASKLSLSRADQEAIGMRIWKNECGGSVNGLTSWNAGEEFPSLGIGHFIWYPEGVRGPFDESFPKLVAFLQAHKVVLPAWLKPGMPAPWKSRQEFLEQMSSERTVELRKMLVDTVPLQTEFIVERMEASLPKMLDKAAPEERAGVKKQFYRVLNSGKKGVFALIDYVNFKGEGVVETERYNGEGWGLLQVLSHMDQSGDPVKSFADSAARALRLRVQNSPPERHESRWLAGWLKRVQSYRQ